MAKQITAGDVMFMEELRKQGLANQQIAHDMGLSTTTVKKYIGPQGKKIRAAYGSIVTHPAGELYSKEELPEMKMVSDKKVMVPAAKKDGDIFLKVVGSITTYQGKCCQYTIDSSGHVRIKDQSDQDIYIPFENFESVVNELIAIEEKISQMKQLL